MRLVRFMVPRLFVTLFLSEFYRNRQTLMNITVKDSCICYSLSVLESDPQTTQ